MPGLSLFLSGFGLQNGLVVNKWKLITAQGSHITVKRYHLYNYPLTLTFRWQGTGSPDYQGLVDQLDVQLTPRIINSEYGNPYNCQIDDILGYPDGNIIIIKAKGTSTRVYI